ncbi:hypothetical protein K8353_05600 [Burkholderia contaminans]|nr:hypothetical protein [Burkholderia contaminans]
MVSIGERCAVLQVALMSALECADDLLPEDGPVFVERFGSALVHHTLEG